MNALHELGLFVGDETALVAADPLNEAGYWEHRAFMSAGSRLLDTFEIASFGVVPFPEDWQEFPEIMGPAAQYEEEIVKTFANRALWGWKDPRTCLLLPVVRHVLNGAGLRPKFVFIARHPVDVTKSITNWQKQIGESSIGTWLSYTMTVLHSLPAEDVYLIGYTDLLRDPRAVLEPIVRDLPFPTPTEERWAAVRRVVRPDLSHRSTPLEALDSVKPDLLKRVYVLLLEAIDQPEAFRAGAFKDRIDGLWQEWLQWTALLGDPVLRIGTAKASWKGADGVLGHAESPMRNDRRWQPFRLEIAAPPGAEVSVSFGPWVGTIYVRKLRLVSASGQSEAVDATPGSSALSQAFKAEGRILVDGHSEQFRLRMPKPAGTWHLEMECLAVFSGFASTGVAKVLSELRRAKIKEGRNPRPS
jgi:hypothetical protein